MTIRNVSEATPLTRGEAAARLRVSLSTVDRLIAEGELPASKVGRSVRINPSDVEALLTPSERGAA